MNCIGLLAQSQSVTNWLTPIWLLSVGISIGFLLVLVTLLKIWICSKLPLFSTAGNSRSFPVWGSILSLLYLAIAVTCFLWYWYRFDMSIVVQEDLLLFLGFAIPFCLLLGFGVWKVLTPRGAEEVFSLFREGFLFWLNAICIAMIAFAIIGYGLAMSGGFGIVKFVDDPYLLLNSATRLPVTGVNKFKKEIPPTEGRTGGTEIPVDFYGEEVQFVTARTDQPLEIATEAISPQLGAHRLYSLNADAEPKLFVRREDGSGRIPNGRINSLFVVNLGNAPAQLEFGYRTRPVHPQVWIIPWSAFWVLMVYLVYMVCAAAFPKVFAVAYSTFKTEVNQPLFLILVFVGLLFILGSIYVPYNTFGEDIKMYKDSGLTLIRVLAIFLAVWAASKSVAEEIDGRTALTVLSKPVGRRQFIFWQIRRNWAVDCLAVYLPGTLVCRLDVVQADLRWQGVGDRSGRLGGRVCSRHGNDSGAISFVPGSADFRRDQYCNFDTDGDSRELSAVFFDLCARAPDPSDRAVFRGASLKLFRSLAA